MTARLLVSLLLLVAVRAREPHSPPVQTLGFGFAFGDDMVLQQAPAKAAVYGFAPEGAETIVVTVASGGQTLYTIDANVSTTAAKQAFGTGFGTRPCPKEVCKPYDMAAWNPWAKPQNSFKALLKPTAATQGPTPQTYTITATCTAGCPVGTNSSVLKGVVFGDMWYVMVLAYSIILYYTGQIQAHKRVQRSLL